MKYAIYPILGLLLLGCSTNTPEIIADRDNGGLQLPQGFSALIVADSIGSARHLVVDDNGVIYVSLRERKNGGGIVRLADTDKDGRADEIGYFGACQGTGIELYDNFLYFGTDTSVIRFPFGEGDRPSETFETIVEGYPLEYQHATKTFCMDTIGNVYVNVGAPSNACAEQDRAPGSPGMDPCPILEIYGGIWQYSASQLGQVHMQDGKRFATGIRNAVAIQWNYHVNELYVVQHGRDQLHPQYKENFTSEENADLPSEEFFLVEEGDDFGWPYCYHDPFSNKKVLAPEYGGDGELVGRCENMKDPFMSFPAHYAPNDLLFYEGDMFPERYRHGAFVAFHGSWNRSPQMQEGFNVVFVPFDGKYNSGDWEVFADNFAGIDPVPSAGDAQHRPCGLAVGPDGSLYVVDSKWGRIWRIFYTGE